MFKFNGTEIENTILQKYIPDYHINLVDAGKIDNLECFQSDLQVILGMLKYRNNKEVQIDMCKALDDLYNDGITQGIKQGIEEGISRT